MVLNIISTWHWHMLWKEPTEHPKEIENHINLIFDMFWWKGAPLPSSPWRPIGPATHHWEQDKLNQSQMPNGSLKVHLEVGVCCQKQCLLLSCFMKTEECSPRLLASSIQDIYISIRRQYNTHQHRLPDSQATCQCPHSTKGLGQSQWSAITARQTWHWWSRTK